MKKSLLLFFAVFVIFFLLGIFSVSASLCKSADGYYRDCNWNDNNYDYRYNNYKSTPIFSYNDNYKTYFYYRDSDWKYNRKSYYKINLDNKDKYNYKEIYGKGYNLRYNQGYVVGYNKGYNLGYEKGYYYGYYKGFKKSYDLGYDDGWSKKDKKLILEPSYPEYLVYSK